MQNFLMMGKTWSDGGNGVRVRLVKAEICAVENFGINSHEIYQFISMPEKVACMTTLSKMETIYIFK
jgi:hypothetical protein